MFDVGEYGKPVARQKPHHVCGMCSQDQTWSGHGTYRCPIQESEQHNQQYKKISEDLKENKKLIM